MRMREITFNLTWRRALDTLSDCIIYACSLCVWKVIHTLNTSVLLKFTFTYRWYITFLLLLFLRLFNTEYTFRLITLFSVLKYLFQNLNIRRRKKGSGLILSADIKAIQCLDIIQYICFCLNKFFNNF